MSIGEIQNGSPVPDAELLAFAETVFGPQFVEGVQRWRLDDELFGMDGSVVATDGRDHFTKIGGPGIRKVILDELGAPYAMSAKPFRELAEDTPDNLYRLFT